MTTRIGICSTAHVNAEVYAALLAKMPGVELVGLSDENPERARYRANAVGTVPLSRRELVRSADGVLVCSSTAAHGELFDLALTNDVAVLCEKPLATSLAEARELRDRCEREGLVAGMAMPLKFSRPIRAAKRAYERGDLGTLLAISGTNRGRMPGGWFTDPDLAGGGAVMDHTDHIVDVVHWITGERVTEVYAEIGTRFYDVPVEDVNLLSMELSDGTSFVLDGSWSTPMENTFWGDATLELIGSDDVVTADCFGQSYTCVRDTGRDKGVESVFWGADPNNALLRDFIGALETGREPMTPLSDGVKTVRVMEAAYESAARDEPVEISY
ncbi:Gfo/Idh/MocA family protein [Halegenticoccus soli]|uniref:Gfo/Idh/MocA family protein n=1 Tax=Halegenticoccus soli TaxID=1985678 RepID=UPI000C6EAA22|nr:Gfo/Idh/MocA family oxidoreductase [Halegenticoccus soli]